LTPLGLPPANKELPKRKIIKVFPKGACAQVEVVINADHVYATDLLGEAGA